ncbi:DnaJ C-terminal domain-containing protein [Asticcacaulis machinosus]|uniref:DnaJ C-terminal domain-containing protein n=1 Tax=Asticcacaulis machinosus TaxID=2984211 RepID=A0ABT5HH53_9CAUL|nr:DnaJ C-terminal domain-containing protein [Asticcacaulis machinosus]MDC7674934.1 DnaJ C-terminal domain-containing protein [Asticcacaulis machinosus]
MNRTDALKILGLCDPVSETDIKSAFRGRIKDVHPDLNPTSDALLRLMIVARDVLMGTQVPETTQPQYADIIPLNITPHHAIHGGNIVCDVPVSLDIIEQDHTVQSLNHLRRLRISLPKGLRAGEILRFKNGHLSPCDTTSQGALLFCVEIALDENITISGNDILIDTEIEPCVLNSGGQISIDTPAGVQKITLKGPASSGSSLLLKGLGLPARGGFTAGDLYVRLSARDVPHQPAAELLNRFTARWG